MEIIALEIEKAGASASDFEPFLADEARAVWKLYQEGFIRSVHLRGDRSTAVLTLECHDIDESRAKLSQLPLVSAGLIEFEFIPLRPYPGFSRLFKS